MKSSPGDLKFKKYGGFVLNFLLVKKGVSFRWLEGKNGGKINEITNNSFLENKSTCLWYHVYQKIAVKTTNRWWLAYQKRRFSLPSIV
jgi:hypothetical protein